MSDAMGYNTHASNPGFPEGGPYFEQSTGTPGAAGPGSSMQVHHGVITIITASAAALILIGVLFRRPIK